jgi:DNA-binding NarL/FixJ family response regulator
VTLARGRKVLLGGETVKPRTGTVVLAHKVVVRSHVGQVTRNTRPRVLLIAMEDVRREALTEALRDAGCEVLACGYDAGAVAAVLSSFDADVILLVTGDNPGPGPDVRDEVCRVAGRRPLLVLSPVAPNRDGTGLPPPVAAGYILTSAGLAEVVRAVRVSACGSLGVGGLGRVAASHRGRDSPSFFPPLTQRQVAVLRMVSRGMSYRRIAGQLHVSPSVVRDEMMRMLKLAGARNQVELVAKAARAGLLRGGVFPGGG